MEENIHSNVYTFEKVKLHKQVSPKLHTYFLCFLILHWVNTFWNKPCETPGVHHNNTICLFSTTLVLQTICVRRPIKTMVFIVTNMFMLIFRYDVFYWLPYTVQTYQEYWCWLLFTWQVSNSLTKALPKVPI